MLKYKIPQIVTLTRFILRGTWQIRTAVHGFADR